MRADLDPIRKRVRRRTTVSPDSVHGPTHWARVEANGVKICRVIGADELVAILFALFHDSMRLNDGHDPEHPGGEPGHAHGR